MGSELELEPVAGPLDTDVEWELVGPVDHDQALCARGLEHGDRFSGVEMPAIVRGLRVCERRLAEKEVGVARKLDETGRRPRVAGVGEDGGAVGHTQAEGQLFVVLEAHRRDLEASRLERDGVGVLAHDERAIDLLGEAELVAEHPERCASAGWHPELGRRRVASHAEARPEDPRDDVAPVIEVEVGERDRVEERPRLPAAQPGEHTRAAVEQETPASLDEVPGLRSSGIGPGGRAADDRELHGPYRVGNRASVVRRAVPVYNSAVARASAEMLKHVPLFADLDTRELEQIAATMRERRFAAGDTVTQEGAGGAGFIVVESGGADVSVDGVPRRTIGPGDYFREIALLTGSDRTATITATSDMLCYGMTPWDFKPLVETNSTIAWKLLTAMAEKLR